MKQPNTHYALVRTEHYLGITHPDDKHGKPFYIDFLSSKMQYRAGHAGLRKERLARAIGMKPKDHPTIIDTTAGLGRDSFILATLGYHVTMLEKSPIIYALLEDGLKRAQQSSPDHASHRLTLIHADAIEWLPAHSKEKKPDVIYLDPMFPERRKSASIKKDMQLLQDLLGHEENIAELLKTALACAGKRVVVKRPRLATIKDATQPSYTLPGNSTRFDIYLV